MLAMVNSLRMLIVCTSNSHNRHDVQRARLALLKFDASRLS